MQFRSGCPTLTIPARPLESAWDRPHPLDVHPILAVPAARRTPFARFYPWIVFALTFGLLLSDYMSRQVLSAVFPLLKVEWALTDAQPGDAQQRRSP